MKKVVQGHYANGRSRSIVLNGWKRQPADKRDQKYRLKFQGPLTAPPPSVDLRKYCSPVEDQADIGSCFPAGTPILMADGTERAIETIQIGDHVVSHTGQRRRVSRVYVREHEGPLLRLTLLGLPTPMEMTGEHPVAIVSVEGNLRWAPAKTLLPGMLVLLPARARALLERLSVDRRGWREHSLGTLVPIESLMLVPPLEQARSVFNLEVEHEHTYVANMIAVHNCTANAAAALVEANQIREGRKALGVDADGADDAGGVRPTAAGHTVTVSNVSTSLKGVVTFTTTVTPAAAPLPPTPTPKFVNVSRLFTYYATRLLDGTQDEDAGAYIRDAIKSMAKYGMIDELDWPYDTSKYAVNPSEALWTAAAKNKITSYHAIADGDLETMKVTLAKGYLIEYGFDVYSYFLTSEMARKGLLCRPKANEMLQGGHAVALCGYDDNKIMPDGSVGAFLARNSWGDQWGLAGYFWHAYNYVGDKRLSQDFWAILSQPL